MSVKKSDTTLQGADQVCRLGYSDLIDIRKRIQFHQAMGISEYPRTDSMELFLEKRTPAGRSELKKNVPADIRGQSTANRSGNVPEQESRLPAVSREIRSCTSCHLAGGRRGTVVGRGGPRSPLMVIGDWSHQDDEFSNEILFGSQEDEMLWKMMAAIDLDASRVYVTNCIKCCPGKGAKVDTKAEKCCFSYLDREIAAVRPQIICAMGDMAARILLGSTIPVVRLRGKMGSYRYQSSAPIAVMPTFHPGFLVRSPEMKKATWNDLQVIRRFLDASRS